jgi:hypothetical protein
LLEQVFYALFFTELCGHKTGVCKKVCCMHCPAAATKDVFFWKRKQHAAYWQNTVIKSGQLKKVLSRYPGHFLYFLPERPGTQQNSLVPPFHHLLTFDL